MPFRKKIEPRGKEEYVLAVVKQSAYALQFASEGLKSDKEVVLAEGRQKAAAEKAATVACFNPL